jgi:ABC-2 type transport system ATP-binding protein
MPNKKPLKIFDIEKSFKRKKILSGINFEVLKGEIFGFIGLNGQGKTTLIKIILDLLDQDKGEVEIFGVSRLLPESRSKICYLPEKFQPSLNQTGEEFIKFTLGFYKKKYDKNSKKRAEEICKDLDLDFKILKEKISKYSKGMTQKLGLLSSFLSEADLVILDEPMSGLDPKARIALKSELINYKNLGKSIFFTSHILSDMDEICDRISVLNEAKLCFVGTPEEFKLKHKKDNIDKAFLCEISKN